MPNGRPKPIIGITVNPSARDKVFGLSEFGLPQDLAQAVFRTGGIPVAIPLLEEATCDYLDLIDGLILSGGPDVFPQHYYINPNQTPIYNSNKKSEFTAQLLSVALETKIVVLGICAGMQAMAGYLGGKLDRCELSPAPPTKSVNHWQVSPGQPSSHKICLQIGSKLSNIVASRSVVVNSLHQEKVVRVPPSITVCARSVDDSIEGIEVQDRDFVLGVQWHPELLPDSPAGWGLIKEFVDAAR